MTKWRRRLLYKSDEMEIEIGLRLVSSCVCLNESAKKSPSARIYTINTYQVCQWKRQVQNFFFKHIAFKEQPEISSYRRCGKKEDIRWIHGLGACRRRPTVSSQTTIFSHSRLETDGEVCLLFCAHQRSLVFYNIRLVTSRQMTPAMACRR